MAELSINITARLRNALTELNKLDRELKQSEVQAEKTSQSVRKIGNQRATREIARFGKTAANAAPAVQEFSRVIQDAPFGIQGVANNIQQLTANFGNLSRSAGGSVAALRLMLGALTGPSGILLAVSIVTAAMVQFGGSIGKAAKEGDKLKDELDAINKEYAASLKLNESQEKLLELQKQSTIEIRQQRIGILGAQIASLQAVQNQNEALLTTLKLQAETVTLWEGLTGLLTTGFNNAIKTVKRDVGAVFSIFSALANVTAEQAGLTGLLAQYATENKDEQKEIKDLTVEINSQQAKINELLAKALELNKGITEEREKQAGRGADQNRAATTTAGLADTNILALADAIVPPALPGIIATRLSDIQLLWTDFSTQLNDIAQNSIAPAFASLGTNIGQALANGGNIISTLGASIIQSFGQFLSQFGQKLIAYGVAALAFSTISKGLLNPLTAAPSAIAAIAIGTALSAAGGALSSLGGRGLGANGVGDVQTNSSFTGSASFSGGGGGLSGGEVVFRIQGQTLVGVLNNTLDNNARLGGSSTIG